MYEGRRVGALIAAAGNGSRMGGDVPKQFLDIGGIPMLLKTISIFEANPFVDDIFVIVPRARRDVLSGAGLLKTRLDFDACGGATRQASVAEGLASIGAAPSRRVPDLVLIHDAARPFVTNDVISRVLEGAVETGAAIPCTPVKDTVYAATADRRRLDVVLDREGLFAVQTPQGFDFKLICEAHTRAIKDGVAATDDGTLARRYGAQVRIVAGDYANVKITTREDLPDAGDRVGLGFDAHAFAEGRALVLGGVNIPFERGLLGHSDADVLTHALMDAILGALNLGDIGLHFPDTDARYRGISSMTLLAEVRAKMERAGYRLGNADLVIVAERPRMAEHIAAMRDSLAAALGTDVGNVSVKATTTEGLGFSAKTDGIGAQAVVRLTLL
jgi:2-C-methyl-D-erythritol 4-phosphate cytidylyltransferase/2-C-methyl-D-erythritol 2,4-cyclodiphosphate synthase